MILSAGRWRGHPRFDMLSRKHAGRIGWPALHRPCYFNPRRLIREYVVGQWGMFVCSVFEHVRAG